MAVFPLIDKDDIDTFNAALCPLIAGVPAEQPFIHSQGVILHQICPVNPQKGAWTFDCMANVNASDGCIGASRPDTTDPSVLML